MKEFHRACFFFIFPNFVNPTLHISNCACFFQISNIGNLILIFYLKRKEIVLELVMHSTLSHFGNFVFVQNEFEIRICIMGLDGDFTGRSDFTVETVLHANTCLFICCCLQVGHEHENILFINNPAVI